MEGVDMQGFVIIGFAAVAVPGIVGMGIRMFVNMFREVIK